LFKKISECKKMGLGLHLVGLAGDKELKFERCGIQTAKLTANKRLNIERCGTLNSFYSARSVTKTGEGIEPRDTWDPCFSTVRCKGR